MIDKGKILQNITADKNVVLEIGCGNHKKNPLWIGIDIVDCVDVDIVGDIYEVIKYFPDEVVSEIHSYHFFEHIQDVPGLLSELTRVLKPGGIIEIVVPHFSNPYYYSDYTHKNFFGLYSFSYLVHDDILLRKVPEYSNKPDLHLQSIKILFSSALYINRPFRYLQQLFFNSSNLMKEWYEDSWSSIFPCYEIRYIIIKNNA